MASTQLRMNLMESIEPIDCGFDSGTELADAAARQGRQTGGDGTGAAAPAWAAGAQHQNGQNGDEPPL